MKKFNFSLQVLLDVRMKEEKAIKGELYKARQHLLDLEKKRNQIIKTKELCEESSNKNSKQGIKVEEFQVYYRYLEQLKKSLNSLKIDISNAQNRCEKILARLVETKKTIKMLEILKEQKYEEYLLEYEKKEMKVLDDFINSRFHSKGDAHE